ncbi:MAG: helix-turn-helix transcriptional regulator [bacterium]|nr:helix-turn-helix transcriptional regulator [bacterium]
MGQDNEFGIRLKQVRKSLRLTQKDFAERLKISGATLSELESGKYKPGHDFFVKISSAFDVNLYYLLFGEGEMFLDPTHAYAERSENFAVNLKDVREFFHYFERSQLVQYSTLAHFKSIKHKDGEVIAAEMETFEKKKPSK